MARIAGSVWQLEKDVGVRLGALACGLVETPDDASKAARLEWKSPSKCCLFKQTVAQVKLGALHSFRLQPLDYHDGI